MFCLLCGNEINNENLTCEKCGWQVPGAKRPAEVIPVNEPDKKTWEGEESDTIDKEETVPSADENLNVTNDDSSVSATVGVSPLLKNKKTLFIVGGIVVVVLLALIFGLTSRSENNTGPAPLTDDSKISEASELIVNGDFHGALDMIYDVESPKADVMKNFIEVEDYRDRFESAAANGIYDGSAFEAYTDFKNKLDEFEADNDAYYLPDNVATLFNRYKTAFDEAEDYDSDYELYDTVASAQSAFAISVLKNQTSKDNGVSFTLSQLQQRVNETNDAVSDLKEYDFSKIYISWDAQSYCKTSGGYIPSSKAFQDMMTKFIDDCSTEAKDEQERINKELTKWDMDDKLYLTNPKKDYTNYIYISYLEDINEVSDVYTNADLIIKILKRDMVYYLINGKSV